MSLEIFNLYPTKIYSGSFVNAFTNDQFARLQELVENLSVDTHSNLLKPQSLPAKTENYLFLYKNHKEIQEIKNIFEQTCIDIHESKFPSFKGKLHVYDSVCTGVIINSLTTIQDTMSNYPWHYTGIAVIRAPENLPSGQGDIVFQDPLPVSEFGDAAGIVAQKGNIAIFPSWLKYRFRPVSFKENENDTVMLLVMNAMIVHERYEEFEATNKPESENSPVFQLGPTGGSHEVELNVEDMLDDKREIDIGRL